MAIQTTVRVDDKLAIAALQRAPDIVLRHLDAGLGRGAEELARTARDNAAKRDFLGMLKQSIHVEHPAPLHYVVAASANYARAVEEGTGPAAGRAPYFPNVAALIPYVRSKALRGGEKLQRARTPGRARQESGFESRAFGLARFIHAHGTKPAPYMAPALTEKVSRIHQLARHAALAGAREVFG